MKNIKFLSLIVGVLACAFTSNAQHTTPRYGTSSSQDNTYGRLALAYSTLTDTLGATVDTIFITPNQFTNNYVLTLKDSCVLAIRNVTGSWTFDQITVNIQNTSGAGHFVNFLGTAALPSKWGMSSTGTKISPASTLSATVSFLFDGVLWDEKGRVIR